ncbi:M28 family peptidase [candidate division KSB1 bacterium]
MKSVKLLSVFLITIGILFSCAGSEYIETLGVKSISEKNLREHIRFISHDLTEGRAPGSRGIKIAQEYIAGQFALNGIQPAGENDTYFQNVPFIKYQALSTSVFQFVKETRVIPIKFIEDIITFSVQNEATTASNMEIVFAGYGIEAPEFGWNDYQDSDISGKIVLLLPGEPPSDEPEFFEGKKDTKYSGWNYKINTAHKNGAEGILFIHTDSLTTISWDFLKRNFTKPRIMLKSGDKEVSETPFRGMISENTAEKLFGMVSSALGKVIAQANSKNFKPVNLGIELHIDLHINKKEFNCRNVIGKIEGKKKDEYIVYTAHSDHLGTGTPVNGDSIYNGAVDNATGCAALIEIGRVFTDLPEKPDRTILLLVVTAEESGLFGSRYYTQNPLFPLEKTLCVINVDGPIPLGEMKDFIFFGVERSSLADLLYKIARDNGMTVTPDPMPEQGFFLRSDHYPFALAGVPGGMIDIGIKFEGKPEGWGVQTIDNWLKTVYHHPSDEYSDDWEMETVVQVTKLAFQLGYRIAKEPEFPTWNDDQPFKAIRDEKK